MNNKLWIVVPASGIGSRMRADRPKQYLKIQQQTIAEITLDVLSNIVCESIVVAIQPTDPYWPTRICQKQFRHAMAVHEWTQC